MKILLFQHHKNDPLGWAIKAVTDGVYTHAAVLVDESKNEIIEAWYPHVRRRVLTDDELPGIDVFAVKDITPSQEAAVVAECERRLQAMEGYSIENLFRFLPVGRAILGNATDDSPGSAVVCSQFAFDVVACGGVKLLNAPSRDIAPQYLSWSPLLIQGPALKPLKNGEISPSSTARESQAQGAPTAPEATQVAGG